MDTGLHVRTVAAVPVEYQVTPGSNGVVVVFHGGHMRADLSVGEHALAAAGYMVLTPSRPGYGRTPLAAGPSPAQFAARTSELCDVLGVERVVAVIGVSAGGPTAVAMAAQQPERVGAVVLLSARSALPFPDGAARVAARLAFGPRAEARTWSAVHTLMRRAPTVGLRTMMGSLSTLPARQVVEDLTAREQQTLVDMFATMRSGAGFSNDVRQPVDDALAQQVTQDALVVASRTDGQVSWRHAEQLIQAIPRATGWVSPSLSHLVWFGSGGPATDAATVQFLRAA